MMAFNAPSPRVFGRRSSEDREEIKRGVTRETAVRALHLRQNRLEAHDCRSLLIAGRAEAGFQKFHRQLALVFVEVLERKSFAVAGDEMPVEPLRVAELETRLRFLFGRE